MSWLNTLRSVSTVALLAVAVNAGAQTKAPDALVVELSNQVLDTIRADPALSKGDPARVQKVVDELVMPHVDFRKMTQLAVGRGWRDASPEQRDALVREFRRLLVFTYSGALSQVSDHKVQLRPSRIQPADTDAVVRTHIVASRGEPIQVDYRLEKSPTGWKIYDINILGVWMAENYRSQFASQINTVGVDGLIKTLADRNKQLEQQSPGKA